MLTTPQTIERSRVLEEIKEFSKTYCWRCERNIALSHGDEAGLWWHKDRKGLHECDSSGFHELRVRLGLHRI